MKINYLLHENISLLTRIFNWDNTRNGKKKYRYIETMKSIHAQIDKKVK